MSSYEAFDPDELPSNSDVIFILEQYMEEMERKRADNIRQDSYEVWIYKISDSREEVRTAPPRKLGGKKS
jgi:hypothetical protein